MKTIKQSVVILVMSLLCSSAWAFSLERYVEGVHYQKVPDTKHQPNTVVEFFSFGCPHCNHVEPLVEKWLESKPEAVQFSRVPATWNAKFRDLGRLYYVIEKLDLVDRAMPVVFDYLHGQNKTVDGPKSAFDALQGLGVSEAEINAAWTDNTVETKTNTAGKIYGQYQIRGVPAFMVNGQYTTTVKMAGSEEELFEVVNFLLGK
ncbi:thiol:disulfide interchange protein DsbA/DsbL [Ketobacter sp.]|uniref:thiol:disulfide interchange protein DsbA/DsbL n=1 Tax=Ketobacter sp. TaxID=2083498 RepID=UPI000F20C789|nr:thiol:disulfide interchange protein DsbA/DsbL [Ketobacter sp.]RLT93041.1 MAG: thiol:disulfide interchange protein DsbA/DsbL [Ketobacter sp.]